MRVLRVGLYYTSRNGTLDTKYLLSLLREPSPSPSTSKQGAEADGAIPDRVIASGEGTDGVACRGAKAKQPGDARGGLGKLDQAVGPSFTLAPGTEGNQCYSLLGFTALR